MTRLLAAVAVLSLLFTTACTEDRPGVPGPPETAGATPCERGLDGALSAWAAAGFSGSVAISTGASFDCLAAYGSADDAAGRPNTTDTTFSIGSITKAFTAAAIMHLVDDGKLTLDDRVGMLLPTLKGRIADATVRQLLLHTSGLTGTHGNDTQPLSRDGALAAIDALDLVAPPGSRYLYSNAGYTLLALIIDGVSGSSYRDYLMSNILRLPDGRVAGGFWNGEPAAPAPRAVGYLDDGTTGAPGDFPGPYWATEGNGGLAMTARDLATWTRALFSGHVVSARSTQAIATPGWNLGDGRAEAPGWVSYDASAYGEPFLATAGGGGDIGHNAIAVWLPRQQRAIAIAANKPQISAEDLLQKIGPALAAGKPLPTPSGRAGSADMAEAVGTYLLPTGGSYRVSAEGNHLVVTATGADAVAALFPPPAGTPVDALRRHEDAVRALLAGQTQEGRKERDAFEGQYGPISGVTVAGSIAYRGEIRTYVSVATRDTPVLGWFALNEAGGVEAAEVPTSPPALRFLPSGADRYHPDDPTGVRPDVTVGFADKHMTLTGPGGTTVARSA
jgi:CubicO group peptidase (beta-lactamase class C family)